jgi:ABC-type transport system involved in multi-copper enzyme maturation permease subunit
MVRYRLVVGVARAGQMRSVWSVAATDLRLWRRMPLAWLAALLPPLAMVAMLEVLSLAVTQQPVALVVDGSGPNTEKMAQIIKDDDDAYYLTVTDASTAARMLADQEVAAVISIPKDFEFQVPYTAHISLVLNNVDIDFADDIRRSVDRSISRFETGIGEDDDEHEENGRGERSRPGGETRSPNPYLINIDEQDLRQTNVEWMNYQVIPALVLLVLNVGLTGTALLCAQDTQRKTTTYLLVTPLSATELIAGRLLGGFLSCLIALIPAVFICWVAHVIDPPASHWLPLFAIFIATALCAAGLGAVTGTLFHGTRLVAMASCVLATYLFLLGGGFTTIAFLPPWLRVLSSLIPIRYAIDGMRQTLFYQTLDGVGLDLIVLCATALAACLAGAISLRRTWAS